MAASPPEDGDHHVEEDLLAVVKNVFHNPREEMKRGSRLLPRPLVSRSFFLRLCVVSLQFFNFY
jgi:hypothetical protein